MEGLKIVVFSLVIIFCIGHRTKGGCRMLQISLLVFRLIYEINFIHKTTQVLTVSHNSTQKTQALEGIIFSTSVQINIFFACKGFNSQTSQTYITSGLRPVQTRLISNLSFNLYPVIAPKLYSLLALLALSYNNLCWSITQLTRSEFNFWCSFSNGKIFNQCCLQQLVLNRFIMN